MFSTKARWWGAVGIAGVVAAAVGALATASRAEEALPPDAQVDRLVVYKAEHTLEAWQGAALLRRYRVALGSGGSGPKVYEGDGKTPEGIYRIDRRHRSARYRKFLHVSYPNSADRRRYGEARRAGRVPDGAGIGGAIGVHGESDHAAVRALQNRVDWTAGCMAVDDSVIDALYRAVVPNAVIEIRARRAAE